MQFRTPLALSLTAALALPFLGGCGASADLDRARLEAERSEMQEALADLKARAEAGDVKAMMELAASYYDGRNVPPSRTEAANWYRMAAEAGLASAQFSVGVLYERGDGVAPNMEEAIRWYAKAAEQNHPQAMNNLGLLLLEGKNLVSDDVQAYRMLEGAASQGVLSSMCALGQMKAAGRGVPQDLEGAVRDFQTAANRGHAPAQFQLAAAYQRGAGVEANEDEARKWLELSAGQDYPEAQAQLGAMLARDGEASPAKAARAAALLRSAADAGIPGAQRNFGLLYFKGLGVEKDLQEALTWYEIAARLGDQAAVERRDRLRDALGAEELANVAARVDAWFDAQDRSSFRE